MEILYVLTMDKILYCLTLPVVLSNSVALASHFLSEKQELQQLVWKLFLVIAF